MTVDGPGARTVVDGGRAELVLFWGGFPAVGAAAGWALAAASGWLVGQEWVPFRWLFVLAARLPDPYAAGGVVALGTIAGLVLAGIANAERLIVSVDRERVRLRRPHGPEREVARRDVRAVFADGERLVLLGADDSELAAEKSDLPAGRLREAFRSQGWPWTDEDPHRDAYRRWVPGLPGLPAGADALLTARQRALDKDRAGEAKELRAELARCGVVIRDTGRRQYWRLTRSAPERGGDFS
ncbi:hypothetical protein [Micromonospora sp. NPDC126480]|uniref:YqeB family protein n=1 Tax=Micromonospora sp. NPDC126480 TaxID=3155312 RepID=UPI00332A1713